MDKVRIDPERIAWACPVEMAGFRRDQPVSYSNCLGPYTRRSIVSPGVSLRRLMNGGTLPQRYDGYRASKQSFPTPREDEGRTQAYPSREPVRIFGEGYVSAVGMCKAGEAVSFFRALRGERQ
jgi:hypothetical protein